METPRNVVQTPMGSGTYVSMEFVKILPNVFKKVDFLIA